MNREGRWRLVGTWVRLFATAMLIGACAMWLINVFMVQDGYRNLIDWEELCGPVGFGVGCLLAAIIELRFGSSKVFHFGCVAATIAGVTTVAALTFASPAAGLDAYFTHILAVIVGVVSGIVGGLSLVVAVVMTLIRDLSNPSIACGTYAWTKMLVINLAGVLVLVACGLACASFGHFWPDANTLVRQAKQNDVAGMKRSLFLGVDPNDFQLWGARGDCEGETPLTAAARAGNSGAARLLLDKGANPDLRNSGGNDYSHDTPLSIAANHGHLEICRILIDNGADPDTITYPNQSPKSGGRWTALDWAIFEGRDEVADYLKGVGAAESGLRSQAMIVRQNAGGHWAETLENNALDRSR